MFMIAMAIALVGYTVFPTAPPRFMPEWGFIDTVSDFTGVHVSHTSAVDERAVQPLRGGALDARRVRADDRLAARAPGAPARRARAVAAVPVPDGLRDRRHRQPLHPRRAARRAHRRRVRLRRELARARAPGAWRFAGPSPAGRAEADGGSPRARRRAMALAARQHAPRARAARRLRAATSGARARRSARANGASSSATA